MRLRLHRLDLIALVLAVGIVLAITAEPARHHLPLAPITWVAK